MPTIQQTLQSTTETLTPVSDTARLDAEVLLAHVLQKTRTWLYTWPETELTDEQTSQFQQLVNQRQQGEPIAYLMGYQEFWSLKMKVTPDTLIPRPETEVLVEEALAIIPDDVAYDIVDLGTGTGAIALALAKERPLCRVTGIDQSAAAIEVARENAASLAIGNVQFQSGNWLSGFPAGSFDLIVANPPYIEAEDPHLQQGDVRFEPRSALVAGADGLDDIRLIIEQAKSCLKPGGRLLMEHGYDQQAAIMQLLDGAGFGAIRGHKDYAGQDRLVHAQY